MSNFGVHWTKENGIIDEKNDKCCQCDKQQ